MRFTFDVQSPERGWRPFVEWMESNGLDPMNTYRIDLTGEGTAMVYEYDLDATGGKFVRGDEVAVRHPRQVSVSCPPPVWRKTP